MASGRAVGLSVIGIVAAIVVIGGGGYYVYNQQNYVQTDNASIQGTIVPIAAPADGVLLDWHAPVGATVSQGAILGQVDGLTNTTNLTSPIAGTIVQNNAIDQEVVVPGEPIGYMVNLNQLQVVANIDETSINNVAVGKTVDITIDAFPNTSFTGTVTQIGSASTTVVQGLPDTSGGGNFNKETQRIPVYISIQGTEGKRLIPGLSAEVSIHRN